MANTQINVNANGTTTLATAGKYCDRNIDVNVNVPGTPTQFTNLYNTANVQVCTVINASVANGVTLTEDINCNFIKIPFHHVKGEPVVLRLRGIGTVRARFGSVVFASDGVTRVNHYSFYEGTYFDLSYDEYGDAMITFKNDIINREWYYFGFNFQYPCIESNATAVTGPIITINEPIGNGGYVG